MAKRERREVNPTAELQRILEKTMWRERLRPDVKLLLKLIPSAIGRDGVSGLINAYPIVMGLLAVIVCFGIDLSLSGALPDWLSGCIRLWFSNFLLYSQLVGAVALFYWSRRNYWPQPEKLLLQHMERYNRNLKESGRSGEQISLRPRALRYSLFMLLMLCMPSAVMSEAKKAAGGAVSVRIASPEDWAKARPETTPFELLGAGGLASVNLLDPESGLLWHGEVVAVREESVLLRRGMEIADLSRSLRSIDGASPDWFGASGFLGQANIMLAIIGLAVLLGMFAVWGRNRLYWQAMQFAEGPASRARVYHNGVKGAALASILEPCIVAGLVVSGIMTAWSFMVAWAVRDSAAGAGETWFASSDYCGMDHKSAMCMTLLFELAWAMLRGISQASHTYCQATHYLAVSRASRMAAKLKGRGIATIDHEDVDNMEAIGRSSGGSDAMIWLGLKPAECFNVIAARWGQFGKYCMDECKNNVRVVANRLARLIALELVCVTGRPMGDMPSERGRMGLRKLPMIEIGLTQHGRRILRTGNLMNESNVPARFHLNISRVEALYVDGNLSGAYRELWINVMEPFCKWAICMVGAIVLRSGAARKRVELAGNGEEAQRRLDVGAYQEAVANMSLGELIQVMDEMRLLSLMEDKQGPSFRGVAASIRDLRNRASHDVSDAASARNETSATEVMVSLCLVKSFVELCANRAVLLSRGSAMEDL